MEQGLHKLFRMLMRLYGLIDAFPLVAVFAITVTLAWLSLEAGFQVGRWRGRRPDHELEAVVRTEVMVMAGLVSFILAFTFWIAASHFDAARQAVLTETNTIRTTFLRADFLPEPYRTEIQNMLRDYVDVRLEAIRTGKHDQATPQFEEFHKQLWSRAVVAREKATSPVFAGQFTQSLNEMIALLTRRTMVRLEFRIPDAIWIMLYVILMIAAGSIGCHAGLTGRRRPLVAISFALIFSVVILFIADLDNPRRGSLMVRKQSLEDLRSIMGDANH
jgi:hypothetical protein